MPDRHWGRTWALSLVLASTAIVLIEGSWRTQGFRPSVGDDPALWAYHRGRMSTSHPKTFALVGTSSIQSAFSVRTARTRLPGYRIAQLAVRGSNPIPSLESLAHDPKFRGIVICSTTESQMADVSLVPGKGQYVYVDWFRRDSSLYRRLDRALAARVEEALVVRNPRLGFANIFQGVFGRSAGFGPSPRIMNFERSRLLDFEQVPRQQVKTWRNKQVLGWRTNLRRLPRPARAWLARARQLESGIERIQQRGGRVVIFHPPLVPESRTFTEQAVPREDYWDAFAAGSSALVIHALDVPGLADIDFPDGSHLDYRDRNKFTHALLDELERHGTFNGR